MYEEAFGAMRWRDMIANRFAKSVRSLFSYRSILFVVAFALGAIATATVFKVTSGLSSGECSAITIGDVLAVRSPVDDILNDGTDREVNFSNGRAPGPADGLGDYMIDDQYDPCLNGKIYFQALLKPAAWEHAQARFRYLQAHGWTQVPTTSGKVCIQKRAGDVGLEPVKNLVVGLQLERSGREISITAAAQPDHDLPCQETVNYYWSK